MKVGPEFFQVWCRNDLVSLARSIVASDSVPVGFIFLSRRNEKPIETHIAARGVVPGFRRKGNAIRMLTAVAKSERAHGAETIDLDTFDENSGAFILFRKVGFLKIRDLPGWERSTPAIGELELDGSLIRCSVMQVNNLVRRFAEANLPWQADEFVLPPHAKKAFTLGHAYCVVSDPYSSRDTIKLPVPCVEPEWRHKGEAIKLIKQ